jgi:thiamine-phosphate pyrophosphorylase
MLLYAITDRTLFRDPEALIDRAAVWAGVGVDFVQIREKDLPAAELARLATGIVSAVRSYGNRTRVLLNGPAEMAAATGCDGLHVPAGLPNSAINEGKAILGRVVTDPVISISCHTLSDIDSARGHGASLAVFAPVFEKLSDTKSLPGQGVQALAEACRLARPMSVFALGGVTAANAQDCINAGAAGIAAIRLFASDEWLGLRGPLGEEPRNPQIRMT